MNVSATLEIGHVIDNGLISDSICKTGNVFANKAIRPTSLHKRQLRVDKEICEEKRSERLINYGAIGMGGSELISETGVECCKRLSRGPWVQ